MGRDRHGVAVERVWGWRPSSAIVSSGRAAPRSPGPSLLVRWTGGCEAIVGVMVVAFGVTVLFRRRRATVSFQAVESGTGLFGLLAVRGTASGAGL